MKRMMVWSVAVLLLIPGIAYAGDFPGLVETLLAVLAGICLLLGLITEGVLSLIHHRKLRWLYSLLYALYWFLGALVVMWSRRA